MVTSIMDEPSISTEVSQPGCPFSSVANDEEEERRDNFMVVVNQWNPFSQARPRGGGWIYDGSVHSWAARGGVNNQSTFSINITMSSESNPIRH